MIADACLVIEGVTNDCLSRIFVKISSLHEQHVQDLFFQHTANMKTTFIRQILVRRISTLNNCSDSADSKQLSNLEDCVPPGLPHHQCLHPLRHAQPAAQVQPLNLQLTRLTVAHYLQAVNTM